MQRLTAFHGKKLFFAAIISILLVAGKVTATDRNTPVLASGKWPPIVYEDENQQMLGVYADILHELFDNRLGIDYQYRLFPWQRAQQEVKEGQADFMIAIPNSERLQYSVSSSEPFFQLYLNIYTYKDHPRLKEIEQIQTVDDIKELGLTTVSNVGNGWQKATIEAAGIKTFYTPTEKNALLFLAKKRADIMVDAVIPTNYIIKNLGISEKLVLTEVRFGPINLHLLMSRKSSFLPLLEQIDTVLIHLRKEGLLGQFLRKYNTLQ